MLASSRTLTGGDCYQHAADLTRCPDTFVAAASAALDGCEAPTITITVHAAGSDADEEGGDNGGDKAVPAAESAEKTTPGAGKDAVAPLAVEARGGWARQDAR